MSNQNQLAFVLKNAKPNDQFVVSGYFREQQTSYFPHDIINICLLYYVQIEMWNEKYIAKVHTLNGNCITHTGSNAFQSSFGTLTVDKSIDEHHWKFLLKKMIYADNTFSVVVGVWKQRDENNIPPVHLMYTQNSSSKFYYTGYGYCCGYQVGSSGTSYLVDPRGSTSGNGYGIKCKDGDELEMHLNFKNLTLSYSVNGKDMGIAIEKIEDVKYKLALCSYAQGNIIELLDYWNT
eukprot:555723_1